MIKRCASWKLYRPQEILRTGFNTLDVGTKELESPIQAIREIGMKRLMGGVAFGLVDWSTKMAQTLTDTRTKR